MNIEILMSTMNREKLSDLSMQHKNILPEDRITVINQVRKKYQKEISRQDIQKILFYNEKGLSRSRNRGLEASSGDIVIIADDDIVYKNNYKKIIEKAYKENPEADVITFQVETPEGQKFKNYPPQKYVHNILSILKVCSIEITFKRERILENEIKFDEQFGLGSQFETGEEAIFLSDCVKKGLKILYIPVVLVKHPKETSGDILNSKGLTDKGAVFLRIYGIYSIFINMLFILKKIKKLESISSILNIYLGAYKYLRRGD